MSKAIVVCSGGMDSVTLAHMVDQSHEEIILISFDYGQRHKKELEFATLCADDLMCDHFIVDMSEIGGQLLRGSALTDDIDVPEGHYADENMKLTVVPNRNAIMLSLATGLAVAEGADTVYTGVHAGDHPVYPDCRAEFIMMMSRTMAIANEGFVPTGFAIAAPFVALGKHDICKLGMEIGVDYTKTWSCYKGGELHCGKCGTCVERKEAFELNGFIDPTTYMMEEF